MDASPEQVAVSTSGRLPWRVLVPVGLADKRSAGATQLVPHRVLLSPHSWGLQYIARHSHDLNTADPRHRAGVRDTLNIRFILVYLPNSGIPVTTTVVSVWRSIYTETGYTLNKINNTSVLTLLLLSPRHISIY
jgi:hypothetical protein